MRRSCLGRESTKSFDRQRHNPKRLRAKIADTDDATRLMGQYSQIGSDWWMVEG